MQPATVIVFPPFHLDWANERLWREEQPIHLRPKTFAVLRYLLEQAVQQADALGIVADQSLRLAWFSEACLLAGDVDRSLELARVAFDLSGQCGEQGNAAWILRLLGAIALGREPLEAATAQTAYQQALALAVELGMSPLQARCHSGLGCLYTKIGQQQQARTALTTAIKLYRAMDMTFWLPEAEATLAQL